MEQFAAGPPQHEYFAPTIGQHFATGFKTRSYVQQYAIRNNLAVKDGRVKNKDPTILLVCKCSGKSRTGHLQAVVGTQGEVTVTRLREARSVLSQMPLESHLGHQLEGVNPYASPENRPLSEEAKQAMFALVRDSSATLKQVPDERHVWDTHPGQRCIQTVPTIIMRKRELLVPNTLRLCAKTVWCIV
ncbi:hypothetical protein V1515DRAFT_624288 [Lipomyces mesembrius]